MTPPAHALIVHARRLAPQGRALTDVASVAAGRLFMRVGAKLLLHPHRAERIDLPARIETNGTSVDVVEDLVEYTGLDRDQVVALIRRRHESFRGEWHALPPALRNEAWFYLSSRTYLFANAIHDAEDLADALTGIMPDSREVLDFGGGTGNLAIALATRGHRVDFVDRSALQTDFVRFRVQKHGLDTIRILDHWVPLARRAYDLVCAFDVLEHLEALAETLSNLLPAIRTGGMLAECSPFVRNVSNPMHHELESEFMRVMQNEGFLRAHEDARFRLWRAERTAAFGSLAP